jgi:hypothetical protein
VLSLSWPSSLTSHQINLTRVVEASRVAHPAALYRWVAFSGFLFSKRGCVCKKKGGGGVGQCHLGWVQLACRNKMQAANHMRIIVPACDYWMRHE